MKRVREQQKPEHTLQQRVGKIDPEDLAPHHVVDPETWNNRVESDQCQGNGERDDDQANGRGQAQIKVVEDPEKGRQGNQRRGDIERVHVCGPPAIVVFMGRSGYMFGMGLERSG